MSTLPQDPPGLARPLPAIEFPMPDFRVPTGREERTIAQMNQSNLDNANDNMRYLGLHVVGVQSEVIVPSITKHVRSAEHVDSDVELRAQGDQKQAAAVGHQHRVHLGD